VAIDRIYVDEGRDIGPQGACFELPGGRARPLDDCASLRERARDELRISRTVVDADLHRALAGVR
jgi:hypothetical protein